MQPCLEELESWALHLQTVYKVSLHQSENTRSSQKTSCFGLSVDRRKNDHLPFSVQSEAKWFRFILAS